MYRDSFQGSLLSVFFANGLNPLLNWDVVIKDGSVTRYIDSEISTYVLVLRGTNVSTTYMTCPKGKQVLGINMPFLVMIVKNLHKYFSFEVTILDGTGTRRRFRLSNFQSTTQIQPLCTVMPINLAPGWNQIQFNLAEFCNRAYQKQFSEVQKLKVNANIMLRRIYFAQKLFSEDELPKEYKLYFPVASSRPKPKQDKENIIPSQLSKSTLAKQEEIAQLVEKVADGKRGSILKPGPSILSANAVKETIAEEVAHGEGDIDAKDALPEGEQKDAKDSQPEGEQNDAKDQQPEGEQQDAKEALPEDEQQDAENKSPQEHDDKQTDVNLSPNEEPSTDKPPAESEVSPDEVTENKLESAEKAESADDTKPVAEEPPAEVVVT